MRTDLRGGREDAGDTRRSSLKDAVTAAEDGTGPGPRQRCCAPCRRGACLSVELDEGRRVDHPAPDLRRSRSAPDRPGLIDRAEVLRRQDADRPVTDEPELRVVALVTLDDDERLRSRIGMIQDGARELRADPATLLAGATPSGESIRIGTLAPSSPVSVVALTTTWPTRRCPRTATNATSGS